MDYHEKRQRVPVPYVGYWWDDPAHEAKAKAGLCYRQVCSSVAHHGWRNTGMGESKYCLHCVHLLNEHNPGMVVPVELSPEDLAKCFPSGAK